MRKAIAFLIMIALGVGFYFYVGTKIQSESKPTSKFEQLMEYDLDQSYPSTPEEVMALYQKIIQYLYSNKVQNQEIEPLISMQRKLFHSELLALNPTEIQTIKVQAEIEKNKETNVKIFDIKQGSVEFIDLKQDKAKMKVIHFISGGEKQYLEYYLIKENDQWKILAWKSIDKFILPEE